VFCTNGPTALGALRALRDCGLRTPRDIAFATFDELTADDLFSPAVTTVVQPAYDIGFRAAGLLLDRIERVDGLDDTVTIRLSANLKVRESSRAAGA
jgi:DNA-binding LacI/PurR family transcriptional regulator